MVFSKRYSRFPYGATLLVASALMPAAKSFAQYTEAQANAVAVHQQGYVQTPSSSVNRPEDAGLRAHTNVRIWRDANPLTPSPTVQNTVPGSAWETPASISCVYKMVTQVPGCPINTTTATPTGGVGAIAIVDAYDNPNAASDLALFSQYYNIPSANFQVVYATGSQPAQDPSGGWELEEALDIEYAHAFSPASQLFLVEAASNSYADLIQAEQVASTLVRNAGGGVVSNSYGGAEFSGETQYDSGFTTPGVIYLASTGDEIYPSYPALSANVLAVGGTSLARDTNGDFTTESYWYTPPYGGGGGLSQFISRPGFQDGIQNLVGGQRGIPDLSSDADPASGVAVYDSLPLYGVAEGWLQVGGTSVASPTIASRIAQISRIANNSTLENYIYGEYVAGTAYITDFRDITAGNSSCSAGWDTCAGIGSPLGNLWTSAPPQQFYNHPTAVSCTNSSGVSNPSGPLNSGTAILTNANTGRGTNKAVQCRWSGFAPSTYKTTVPMTLSFDVYAEDDSQFDLTYFGITGFGNTYGNYEATYSVTIPVNTDLSTLVVTAEAYASNIEGDGCEIDIGPITLQ